MTARGEAAVPGRVEVAERVAAGRALELFNSLGRRVEQFRSSGSHVDIFSCGPMMYAFPHLGVLRAFVGVDALRRTLRWKGLPTRHVIMLTDISRRHSGAEPDAVIDPRTGLSTDAFMEVAGVYAELFRGELRAMGILTPDETPRASAYVGRMIEFARRLEETGFAYPNEAGLYLDTGRVAGYGSLALIDTAAQREGVRGQPVPGRRTKTDFSLWRLIDRDTHNVGWDSPWGWGLPGPHLPCSTATLALLGPHFDIHTGGKHHRALHHVNEIAQSEAYLRDGRPWVRYWVHHDALTFNDQPVVRGRAPRLNDLAAAGVHPMACRLYLLGSHYRRGQSFGLDSVRSAQVTLRRLVARIAPLGRLPDVSTYARAAALLGPDATTARALLDRLDAAVCADVNTPQALAALQRISRSPELADDERRVLVAAADAVLGLRLGELRPEHLDGGGAVPAAPWPAAAAGLVQDRRAETSVGAREPR